MFSYFECFDASIYYSILFSLLIVSTVISIHYKSIEVFFKMLWIYSSVILSDYYAIKFSKTFDRIISGVWLIACTVLLAAISGQLWNQLIRRQPLEMIESWNDLYCKEEFRDLKITAFKLLN